MDNMRAQCGISLKKEIVSLMKSNESEQLSRGLLIPKVKQLIADRTFSEIQMDEFKAYED